MANRTTMEDTAKRMRATTAFASVGGGGCRLSLVGSQLHGRNRASVCEARRPLSGEKGFPWQQVSGLSPGVSTVMSAARDDDKKEDETDNDMTVYQKNGRQRRGMKELPFDVSIISPPPRHLGQFLLDPLTHCGDIVEHEGNHFEVKVVRLRYKYSQGQYKVVGKKIEVKSLARKAIELYLEQQFKES